jgi:hypothetical protein
LINQLLIFFTTICIYEFIKLLNFFKIIESNLKIIKKMIELFNDKKSSDSTKEKLILDYSKFIFFSSIKIFVIILCIVFFIFLIKNLSYPFFNFIFSGYGIIEITLISLIYRQIREKINAKL